MGRRAESSVVASGDRVGYSLTTRPDGYRVRFVTPAGKRVERATGCDRKGEAGQRAEFLNHAAYAPASDIPATATWAEALADLDPNPRPTARFGPRLYDRRRGCSQAVP